MGLPRNERSEFYGGKNKKPRDYSRALKDLFVLVKPPITPMVLATESSVHAPAFPQPATRSTVRNWFI